MLAAYQTASTTFTMDQIVHIIEQYGIYAVFVLCTVEGDITLLTSGVMAHSGSFGPYSFLQVFIAGTSGALVGDIFGYFVGRLFRETVKKYRYFQMVQPRVEQLVDKFGAFAIIISKYIWGVRVGICIFYGVSMPFWRYLVLDVISCVVWVLMLAGVGYFFGGAITTVIGDFHQLGIALAIIVVIGIVAFYLIERFWLSKKVEQVKPQTIQKIEEKIHVIEEGIQERFHLSSTNLRDEINPPATKEPEKTKTEANH